LYILKSFEKKVKSWIIQIRGLFTRMSRWLFDIGRIGEQAIKIKSAVGPSLWICAIISLPLFILASITNVEYLRIVYIVIACIVLLPFIISYFYFTFTDPSYLRSEEYQSRMRALQLLGDRDNPFGTRAEDIVDITNPRLPTPTEQNKINDK